MLGGRCRSPCTFYGNLSFRKHISRAYNTTQISPAALSHPRNAAMQILVGTSNDSQKLDAKQWLCHICRQAFLNELEIWITNRESTWGSCRAFAEIVLLPGRRRSPRPHNQIDLLICFEDRVAHCELKGFSSYQDLDLGRVRSQVNGERDWLKSVLSDGGFWQGRKCTSVASH